MIATGTAILIGAGVAAAGGVANAKIQSNASKRATQAQENAAREAIAYQERMDAEARRDRQAAAADWQRQYNAYLKRFYDYDPEAESGGGGGDLRASSGGGPTLMPQDDTIAGLIRGIGAIRTDGARGNPLARGGAAEAVIKNPGEKDAGLETSMFKPGGWNDWDNYLNSGGVY